MGRITTIVGKAEMLAVKDPWSLTLCSSARTAVKGLALVIANIHVCFLSAAASTVRHSLLIKLTRKSQDITYRITYSNDTLHPSHINASRIT